MKKTNVKVIAIDSLTFSKVVKNNTEYFRVRRTYNGVRKDFFGHTKEEVLEKIVAFEKQPTTSEQKKEQSKTLAVFMKECALSFAKTDRQQKEPSAHQLSSIKRVEKLAKEKSDDTNSQLANTQIRCITKNVLSKYVSCAINYGYARSTINQDLKFIRRCLDEAVRKGLLTENPSEQVSYVSEDEVKKPTKIVPPLENDEIRKFLKEALRTNTDGNQINGPVGSRVYGTNADVLRFLFYTGLRVGECLALRWTDFKTYKGEQYISVNGSLKEKADANGKTALVRGTTKTKSSVRTLPLCDKAVEIINEQKALRPTAQPNDYIFLSDTNTPIRKRNVNRTMETICVRAGIWKDGLCSHALRHTYASFQVSNGCDLFTLSKMLGHSSIAVTEKIYAEPLNNKKLATLKSFDTLDEGA